jgi:hypothetical protein
MLKAGVEAALRRSLERVCDFDPERTISIPIRGTDKCLGDMHVGGGMDGESECFKGLAEYMHVAEEIRKYDPRVDTIILTSDDERYLRERHDFEADGRWRFVVNVDDTVRARGRVQCKGRASGGSIPL